MHHTGAYQLVSAGFSITEACQLQMPGPRKAKECFRYQRLKKVHILDEITINTVTNQRLQGAPHLLSLDNNLTNSMGLYGRYSGLDGFGLVMHRGGILLAEIEEVEHVLLGWPQTREKEASLVTGGDGPFGVEAHCIGKCFRFQILIHSTVLCPFKGLA